MRLVWGRKAAVNAGSDALLAGKMAVAAVFGVTGYLPIPAKTASERSLASRIYRVLAALPDHAARFAIMNVGEDVVTALSFSDVAAFERELMDIDEDHLGRMTLGDCSLEREVLEIFARQTTLILERIAKLDRAGAAAAAHTLKGSARGIGAWRVAQAAERLERAAGEAADQAFETAIAELKAASSDVRTAIGARLAERAA